MVGFGLMPWSLDVKRDSGLATAAGLLLTTQFFDDVCVHLGFLVAGTKSVAPVWSATSPHHFSAAFFGHLEGLSCHSIAFQEGVMALGVGPVPCVRGLRTVDGRWRVRVHSMPVGEIASSDDPLGSGDQLVLRFRHRACFGCFASRVA